MVDEIREHIKNTAFFGTVYPDEIKRFDDTHFADKDHIFQCRLSEIKFFTGEKEGKETILGLQTTYTKISGEKIVNPEYRDKVEKEIDIKTLEIPSNDYICNFFLRSGDDRITFIKLVTKKGKTFTVGTEEGGEEKIVDFINDNKNHMILYFLGGYRKVLEAIGAGYIPINKYLGNSRGYFELKRKIRKKEIKDNIDVSKLKESDQVLFRVCNLPDNCFNSIIKYCLL